jgi:hypothetical protein
MAAGINMIVGLLMTGTLKLPQVKWAVKRMIVLGNKVIGVLV